MLSIRTNPDNMLIVLLLVFPPSFRKFYSGRTLPWLCLLAHYDIDDPSNVHCFLEITFRYLHLHMLVSCVKSVSVVIINYFVNLLYVYVLICVIQHVMVAITNHKCYVYTASETESVDVHTSHGFHQLEVLWSFNCKLYIFSDITLDKGG